MNSDWIKMRSNLDTDPDVIAISRQLGLDEFAVVGRLHKFWSWADRHVADGILHRTPLEWIDRFVSQPGFAAALVTVGWLKIGDDSLHLPNWNRHNGSSAKVRARDAIRKKEQRTQHNNVVLDKPSDKCPENVHEITDKTQIESGQNLDKTWTRVEERREENNRESDHRVCARAKGCDELHPSGDAMAHLPHSIQRDLCHSAGPPTTTNQQPNRSPSSDEEWMAALRESFPDRDVEGELRSFHNFCHRKGTVANRHGFVGWLKKASPALQLSEPLYTY